jgi:drug/metabolite transporter (DMT)-like permease
MTDKSNDTQDRTVALPPTAPKSSLESLILCAFAVLAFSLTLPATKAAIPELGALFVGLGRAGVAGLFALSVLWALRERFPREHVRALSLVALGVVFGFPISVVMGLRSVPSTHASVVIGVIPVATALYAMVRKGERPSSDFWRASIAGLAAVVLFAQSQGGIELGGADGWLVLAVLLAAFGYAEGALLAKHIGGFRVISWALVLSLPISVPVTIWCWPEQGLFVASGGALVGFAYVSLVSMYLGMVAWYRGLSRGSLARASQIQLIQPVLSLVWAWLWLGEPLDAVTVCASVLVLASAAWARRAHVALPPERALISAWRVPLLRTRTRAR